MFARNVGYPAVNITEALSRGAIKVEQHRLLQHGTIAEQDNKILYRECYILSSNSISPYNY